MQGNWHMVQQLQEVAEEQCLVLRNLSNHQHPFANHHLPLRHCLEEWEQHLINAGYIKIISYPILNIWCDRVRYRVFPDVVTCCWLPDIAYDIVAKYLIVHDIVPDQG